MEKAGKALKQVLKTYGISQNHLAVTMGVGGSNIHRWVNENRDPVAEAVLDIRKALWQIDPEASAEFIRFSSTVVKLNGSLTLVMVVN